MDKFRYNKQKAPEKVQEAWQKADKLPKHDPKRADLFEAILNAHKGNYEAVLLLIEKKWSRETGMHP